MYEVLVLIFKTAWVFLPAVVVIIIGYRVVAAVAGVAADADGGAGVGVSDFPVAIVTGNWTLVFRLTIIYEWPDTITLTQLQMKLVCEWEWAKDRPWELGQMDFFLSFAQYAMIRWAECATGLRESLSLHLGSRNR